MKVSIQNASIAVTGTFWQATQPVSGPLTDAELRATPVPVSGTVATGGLTDTQLRATPVPVSGTVTANAGTNLNTSALATEAGHLATIDTSTAATAAVAGTTAGAAVITDANGTLQQYLRGIIKLAITGGGWLVTASIAAGTALIGKVGIDQTTPGTTNAVATIAGQNGVAAGAGAVSTTVQRVTLASDDPAVAVLGTVSGAKVVTDANGTIQQYLRGLITFLANALGAGTAAAANRVTLASDDPAVATLGSVSGAKVVTDANGTLQQYLRGLVTFFANALGAGTAAAAHRTTLASDDPAVATLGATSGAKVITDANGTIQQYLRGIIYQLITAGASFFTPVPDTVNGWLVAQMTSADGSTALTNTAQAIKASAGKIGGWYIYNPNASAVYIPIYNVAAASVTVGTTNPQMTLCIPATSAANVEFAMGIPFSNAGFSCAATTTGGGSTAPASAVEANWLYK